eukprot:2402244-Rhodomonas_salina.1
MCRWTAELTCASLLLRGPHVAAARPGGSVQGLTGKVGGGGQMKSALRCLVISRTSADETRQRGPCSISAPSIAATPQRRPAMWWRPWSGARGLRNVKKE